MQIYIILREVSYIPGGIMISRIDLRVIIILAVIIGIGGCTTLFFMHYKDSQLREKILTETRLAASGIDLENIRHFNGSDTDLTNPAYTSMKEKLADMKAAEPLSRFVYIMGQRDDGGVFFYVDSETPGTEGYSPPGQDYPEVTDPVREIFTSGKEGIVGPTTDRWGTWINGLLPVKDPKTGEILGVFGIDIDAGNWTLQVIYAGLPPLVGTFLIIVIFLSFITINRRKDEEHEKLAISEQAYRESEARLSAILQSSPAFQFVIDQNHTVISWNRALEKFSGIPASEMIGTKNHWKAFFPTERPLLVDALLDRNFQILNELYGDSCHPSDLIDGAYEMTRYYPEMKENGIWLYILAAPYKNDQGEIIGAVETLIDVTERHRAEEAVKEAVKKLNLLSSITRHDILNKITMLQGLMMLIAEAVGHDSEATEYVNMGKGAITAIKKQIEFTRTYQDIGLNKPEWNEISDIILNVSKELIIKDISLSISLDGIQVYADPLIRKVFYNLMDNSIRHGEGITRICCTYDIQDDTLVIRYADDGMGVSPDEKTLIFEKGYGKNSGLGMFLAREILSITHITIRETGEYQKGALFEILVPKGMYRFSHPEQSLS